MDENDFERAELGDAVLIRRSFAGKPMIGITIWTGSDAIRAVAFLPGGGARHFEVLRHVNDPWLKEHPQWVDEEIEAGVYELAITTTQRRKAFDKLSRIDEVVCELERRMAALEEQPATPEQSPQRGPGRPRKPKLDAEMATA